jgi:hypothetical protein
MDCTTINLLNGIDTSLQSGQMTTSLNDGLLHLHTSQSCELQ